MMLKLQKLIYSSPHRFRITAILFGYIYFCWFVYNSFLPLGNFGYLLTAGYSVATALVFAIVAVMVLVGFWNAYHTKDTSVFPTLLCQLVLLIFSYLFWLKKGSTDEAAGVVLLLLLAIPAQNLRMSGFLRISFIIGCSLVIVAFILSMTGIIENNRGNSFGFIYRTDYACHLLFLLLIYCFYYDGKLSKSGEIGIFLLFLYNLFLVGGKTADICILLVLFVTYLRHYRIEGHIPFQQSGGIQAFVFRVLYLPCTLYEFLRCRFFPKLFNQESKQTAIKFGVFSFVIFAVVSVGVTSLYHYIPVEFFDVFPKLGSIRARLSLGIVGFDIYPIRFFGNDIISRGLGRTEQTVDFYYFLDCSYVKMLLEYGSGLFLTMLIMMTILQVRLFRKKQYYRCFLLAIVALDGVMEHHLTDISYNLFPMLALACPDYVEQKYAPQSGTFLWSKNLPDIFNGWCSRLSSMNRNGVSPVSSEYRSENTPLSSLRENDGISGSKNTEYTEKQAKDTTQNYRKKLCKVYACISLLLFIPAFATAYRITTCSVQTPDRAAVLLLPGNYMEGYASNSLTNKRIDTAASYLLRKPDSVCVVSGAEADDWIDVLTARGVSPERLYKDSTSKSLLEALQYGDFLIEKEQLPDRKTVCTFAVEQDRVKELAHELHTPVNGLPITLDGFDYARCFGNEQLQLIRLWVWEWSNTLNSLFGEGE